MSFDKSIPYCDESGTVPTVSEATAEGVPAGLENSEPASGDGRNGMSKIRVTISNALGSLWATPEQLSSMTDLQIVALVREDLIEFVDDADWTVERK